MTNKIFFLLIIMIAHWGNLHAQKTVKVLHTFKGQGNIGNANVIFQLNLQSNGILKGFYTAQINSKNVTYFLEGNPPIGESQQTTVYISENSTENSYLIIPYDIEDLEIIIGKWYSLDGTKSQEVYVKRVK